MEEINESSLNEFFSLIERWEGLEMVLEHQGKFFLCSTNPSILKGKYTEISKTKTTKTELLNNLVIKVLLNLYKGPLYCSKTRFKNKRNLINKFKNSRAILIINHG